MQITAFNTPQDPSWRWRILNYAGEVVAESNQGFASIRDALVHGKERLATMDADQVQAVKPLTVKPVTWRARHPGPG